MQTFLAHCTTIASIVSIEFKQEINAEHVNNSPDAQPSQVCVIFAGFPLPSGIGGNNKLPFYFAVVVLRGNLFMRFSN